MPVISVIVPCFNAEPWIRETLNSAVSQQVEDIEIIVIDDGSTDDSANIIEKEFPFVSLIRTENAGPSKTRNLGIKLSKGDFIQFLDADDLLVPGKLRYQLEALRSTGADVAYGDWQRLIECPDGKYIKGEQIRRKLQNPEIDLFTDFWCPPAVFLFRRKIVEKIGGFKESLPIIQDARFSLDCALYGGKFTYCPGIAAYYRTHSEGSVSSRDPIGFTRDILRNAIEVEKWWQDHGGIDQQRKKALIKVYGYIARASFRKDDLTFETAYRALEILKPGYIPERPAHLRLTSRLLGYRRAEVVALWYRKLKRLYKQFVFRTL